MTTKIPTDKELQDFAINFEERIVAPLVKAGYDQCNVFDILNIKRQELRHSDFLAFLFDSNKSGDIGREFLKNFLVLLAQKNKIPDINFFDILYGTIKNVNVYRELTTTKYGQIDILIDFEFIKGNKEQRVVIVIENKIDSDQHDNQLVRYRTFLATTAKYKEHKKIMLYLTADSADSGDNEWASIDYELIAQTLDLIDIKVKNTDESIKILIEDYKKIIRSEFMDESKQKEKALEIYNNNKEILDFIFKCKPDWAKETSKILCRLLKQKGAKIVTANSNGELVETTKDDPVFLAFKTKELANYPTYYFQINIKGMCLLFRKDLTHQQPGTSRYYLFGTKQDSIDAMNDFEEKVVSNIADIEIRCQQAIEQIFAPNGIIDQYHATLEK